MCTRTLTALEPKVAVIVQFVSTLLPDNRRSLRKEYFVFFLIVRWLSSHCVFFSLNCAPRVCSIPRFGDSTAFQICATHGHNQYRDLEQEKDGFNAVVWLMGDQRSFHHSK
jgi:hypothetical protein